MQSLLGLLTPALIISVLALLFTVFSFWWMNWRKGKLHIGIPRAFAAFGSKEARLIIEFPFVFFNDGPMPIVVQNLRLVFLDEKTLRPLIFVATVTQLGKHDESRALATQFPVKGREALLLICEFHRQPGELLFEEKTYKLDLQAKLDESKKWKSICRFSMNVTAQSAPSINKMFIAHDNMVELQ